MACVFKELAAFFGAFNFFVLFPWGAAHFQHAGAQAAGHHAVVAVVFQAVALEPLHRPRPIFDGCFVLFGNGEPEHRQAAIGFPIRPNGARDTLPRFGEAAFIGLGKDTGILNRYSSEHGNAQRENNQC